MMSTLKETLDRIPGSLLITDTESRVVYASAALERRTGFAVAEIVGKKPGELWGGKMRKQFYSSMWKKIETKQQPFVGEVKNTRKNGMKQDEHIFIVPIRDSAGITEYFAEIHPELSGRESEIDFGREFLKRTGKMKQDADFFTWVFETLGRNKEGVSFLDGISVWQGEFRDAASFLRETFIVPTEEKYLRRREDAMLIAEAQKNPEQFSRLYKKYVGVVREYFLRRLCGDEALSEDLTQEVFVRAFRYLPSFHMANASYYTYLLRVAHNALVNYYRKGRHVTIPLFGSEEHIGIFSLPEENMPERTMDALLTRLSEIERSVMLWKYRDGLKIRDIAIRLGKTENAVKLILSRTRKKLKESFR